MKTEELTITTEKARKLFLVKQHLVGNRLKGNFDLKLTSLLKDVAYIQWDPVTVVAPSHLISIWSRIGSFNWADLDRIMFEAKEVFLHWTPIASLVLSEDYPIFYTLMKGYPESLGKSWRNHVEPAREFIDSRKELRKQVLDVLSEGAAATSHFNGIGKREKSEDGWSTGNEASKMLYQLHMMGDVMVSGHIGNQNTWSLTNDFLPEKYDRKVLPTGELERETVLRSFKALGAAAEFDINRYFVRGRYRNLRETLGSLEKDGEILKVRVEGENNRRKYFIMKEDMKMLEDLDNFQWEDSLKLISPFDNILSVRERVRRLFSFDYTLEQFVPKEKRKFGTYVLPILWQDKLVGRIDMKLDKDNRVLNVNSIYSEKGVKVTSGMPTMLRSKLDELARFLSADTVSIGKSVPEGWGKELL